MPQEPEELNEVDEEPDPAEEGTIAPTEDGPDDDESGPPEESTDPFDPELIARARDYGFTAAESRSFGTPENLNKALRAFERSAMRARSAPVQRNGRSEAPRNIAQTEEDDFDIDLPEADFTPELVNVLKKMKERYDREISVIKKTNEALALNFRRQEAAAFQQRFDQYVGSLDDSEIFGEGLFADLAEGSPEYLNRVALVEEMDARSMTPSGRNLSESELVQKAYASAFPERVKSKDRRALTSKLKMASRQAVGPGRARKSNENADITGHQRANEAVSRKLKKLGYE